MIVEAAFFSRSRSCRASSSRRSSSASRREIALADRLSRFAFFSASYFFWLRAFSSLSATSRWSIISPLPARSRTSLTMSGAALFAASR